MCSECVVNGTENGTENEYQSASNESLFDQNSYEDFLFFVTVVTVVVFTYRVV